MLKAFVQRVCATVLSACAFITGLSLAQRKLLYKAAGAVGLAICIKFGLDSHDAAQWIATAVTFVSTVLVPILAHSKATDQ